MKTVEFRTWEDHDKMRREFHLSIEERAIHALDLSETDLAFFKECDASNEIHDKLLAIETLVRHISEHEKKKQLAPA